jgi:hypothetical protein
MSNMGGRDASEVDERRGRELAELIMGDQDGREDEYFLNLKSDFRDICQSGASITWGDADRSYSVHGPVLYFAMRMALSSFDSSESSTMHSEGRLLRFLVKECVVDLNAEYSFQIGDHPEIVCNAMSQAMHSTMYSRGYYDDAIPVMRFLLTLGANPNQHFIYRSIDGLRDITVDSMNNHSLLYVAFQQSNLEIGELLFEFEAHFDTAVDPSPMSSAMQFNNNANIIHMFNKYRHLLSPQDIATDRSELGTPLHSLASNPPNNKQEGERLASILVRNMCISPSMVDSKGRTPVDYAQQLRNSYLGMRNVDPMYTRRAQETMTLLQNYIDMNEARQNSVAAHQVLSHFLPDDERRIVQDYLRRHHGRFVAPKLVEDSIARARAAAAARHTT